MIDTLTKNEENLLTAIRSADETELQLIYTIIAAASNESLRQVAERAEKHEEWLQTQRPLLMTGLPEHAETEAQAKQLFVNYNLPELSADVAKDDVAWDTSMDRILATARRITNVCNIIFQMGTSLKDMANIPDETPPEQ